MFGKVRKILDIVSQAWDDVVMEMIERTETKGISKITGFEVSDREPTEFESQCAAEDVVFGLVPAAFEDESVIETKISFDIEAEIDISNAKVLELEEISLHSVEA